MPDAQLAANTLRFRVAGAGTAAVLAVLAFGGCYALTTIPAVDAMLPLRLALGSDGVTSSYLLLTLALWAVPPVAAAIAGAASASRAVRGEPWAGAWMGALTYVGGIALGAIAFMFTPGPGRVTPSLFELVSALEGVVVFSMLAGVMLAPLAVVCVAAGMLWAWALPRVMAARGGVAVRPGESLPVSPLVAIGVLLMVLWLLLVGLMTGGGVD